MSPIPVNAFRLEVIVRLGDKLQVHNHNYNTLSEAMVAASGYLHKPRTTRVRILVVLEELVPLPKYG